jgi:hypothetical protein
VEVLLKEAGLDKKESKSIKGLEENPITPEQVLCRTRKDTPYIYREREEMESLSVTTERNCLVSVSLPLSLSPLSLHSSSLAFAVWCVFFVDEFVAVSEEQQVQQRQAQLQKLKHLLFYQELKWKRQKKIKSKT